MSENRTDQYVTFHLDHTAFGIPVDAVQEALHSPAITPVPDAPAYLAGLVNLRGQVVTALNLRPRLGMPPAADATQPMLVVVSVDDVPLALLADRVGDVRTVDPDTFVTAPPTLPAELRALVLGAFATDDGLLLTLDLHRACDANG